MQEHGLCCVGRLSSGDLDIILANGNAAILQGHCRDELPGAPWARSTHVYLTEKVRLFRVRWGHCAESVQRKDHQEPAQGIMIDK